MTVGQVPPALPTEAGRQPPTRQRTVSLQAWPPLAKVTAPHVWVDPMHARPVVQSTSSVQGAPAAPGPWHVEGPVTAGHTKGEAQSCSWLHVLPIPPGAVHTWVESLQLSPALHCTVPPLQLAPAPP